MRAPSDECRGGSRPRAGVQDSRGELDSTRAGLWVGRRGGRNAKGRESTLGCRRSQLVNHEVVPPVRAEVGSGRPRESTGCGARLGCGPAPLQVAFAKDVRYRGHELGVAEGLVAVQVGLRVVGAEEFRWVEAPAVKGLVDTKRLRGDSGQAAVRSRVLGA